MLTVFIGFHLVFKRRGPGSWKPNPSAISCDFDRIFCFVYCRFGYAFGGVPILLSSIIILDHMGDDKQMERRNP
jgi:hypothetical protein